MTSPKNKIKVSTQVQCLPVENSDCLPVKMTEVVESMVSSLTDKKLDRIIEHLDVAVTNTITENMTYFEDKLNKSYADILKGSEEVTKHISIDSYTQ